MVENRHNFENLRVFITGAEGFIGSHLTEALVNRGARVTALVLYNSFGKCGWLDDIDEKIRGEIQIEHGDIRDRKQIHSLVEGNDLIFHLAALISIPYSYEAAQSFVDVNIHGTLNMLDASRNGSVGRLIHTSTSEVYGSALHKPIAENHPLHGQSPYAASKIGADQMVEAFARSHDVPAITLRPFNTFGPRQSERAIIPTAIRQMLDPECKEIRLGSLDATRDFTYVGDTVEAFISLAKASDVEFGTVYNAGTGLETKIEHVIQHLRKITSHGKPVISDDTRIRPEQSEVAALVADSGKLNKLCGWSPKTEFVQGLEICVNWWRNQIANGQQRRDSSYAR